MKRILVVYAEGGGKPHLKLEVLDAEMIFPGWMRFTLEAGAPDYGDPTVCWYRVPDEMSVELQHEIEDQDVLDRLAGPPVVDVTPDPKLSAG